MRHNQMRGPHGPHGGPGGPSGKRGSKNPVKTLLRVLSYALKNYPLHCIFLVICTVVSTLVSVRGTLFIRDLIDTYISPFIGEANHDYTPLLHALLQIGALYLIGTLSTYLTNRIMISVSQGSLKNIRDSVFAHMQKLPIPYFDTHTHGDLMSVYTNDTDTLRQLISQSIPQVLSALITVVSTLWAMISLSLPLTGVAIIVLILALFITRTLGMRSAGFFRAQQRNIGRLNSFIEEMVDGQKVVKVFCHEEKAKSDFAGLNNEWNESCKNANGFANILMPIMGNMGYLNFVCVAIVGSFFIIRGDAIGIAFTAGSLVAFLQFTRNLNMPVSQISQQVNSIVMALAGAERVFDLLDAAPEANDGYVRLVNAKEENGILTECTERTGMWAWKHPHGDGTVTYTRLKGDVVFEDVSFGYTQEKIVLHDINLYAKPGQKVAFVGATGAGKTTITNLINRFYDIQEGKIRYDGINITKINKDDLRRSLGIVLQDTHLFTGTVRDNIRYGRLDATDEEVVAAAKLANADYFISHLPNGYDTMLTGDGANLSQGQRQLLAIARAAVADPPVLILDEATSSIDTRTEAIVAAGMDSLMRGRTVFVIAHRLSTVRNSDVILVLENGRIIERGDHESLLDEKGKYYQLYTGAFELS